MDNGLIQIRKHHWEARRRMSSCDIQTQAGLIICMQYVKNGATAGVSSDHTPDFIRHMYATVREKKEMDWQVVRYCNVLY